MQRAVGLVKGGREYLPEIPFASCVLNVWAFQKVGTTVATVILQGSVGCRKDPVPQGRDKAEWYRSESCPCIRFSGAFFVYKNGHVP